MPKSHSSQVNLIDPPIDETGHFLEDSYLIPQEQALRRLLQFKY